MRGVGNNRYCRYCEIKSQNSKKIVIGKFVRETGDNDTNLFFILIL